MKMGESLIIGNPYSYVVKEIVRTEKGYECYECYDGSKPQLNATCETLEEAKKVVNSWT